MIVIGTEILVMREAPRVRDGRRGSIEPRRAHVVDVRGGERFTRGARFAYRLVGDADMAGHNGWRAFENEGVTWAVGWDDDTATALADHPRPVRDNP